METPAIGSSTYSSTAYAVGEAKIMALSAHNNKMGDTLLRGRATEHDYAVQDILETMRKEQQMTKRVVQVFIVDPDENVPIDNSLVYKDEASRLTDLTDQELFFEIDIKSLLDAHNKKRVTLINKKVKERTEMLEPARIRDLKMVVVDIAKF